VALWPEPTLRWPGGFRAYPAQTTTQLEPLGGLVAGTKTFHYLVVPDSAGSFLLPELRYPYYDLARGGNVVLRTAPRALAVAPGVEPRAARSLPPLLRDTTVNRLDAVADLISPPGWLALLVIPPALLVWRRRRRPAPATAAAAPGPALSGLGRLEREFHAVLANHVPQAYAREGDALARALRASGVESAVADHVMRLRDRLRAARYGPRGVGDAAELAAELRQVLQVLEAEPPGHRRRVTIGVGLILLCTIMPTTRGEGLQTPSAEALYEAGALRAAADSFAARASAAPRIAAHWYNLGATLYRAGADGKAIAAWTRAARLAPRNGAIRRARVLLPLPDDGSEALLTVGPATPGEWWLVAAPLWLLAWLFALGDGRRFLAGALGTLAAAAALLGGMEWRRREQAVAVVVTSGTAVRVAPYGAASASTTLDAGAAVLVGNAYGRWLEVTRGDGVRGWVLGTEVARL
jgi:tetratricopeptide (TPR) repeat protein